MIGRDTMPTEFRELAESALAKTRGSIAPREFIDLCLIFVKYVEIQADWNMLNNMTIALTAIGARVSENSSPLVNELAQEFPLLEDDVHAFDSTYKDWQEYWQQLKVLISKVDEAYSSKDGG